MSSNIYDIHWLKDKERSQVAQIMAGSLMYDNATREQMKFIEQFTSRPNQVPMVLTRDDKPIAANFYVLHRKVILLKLVATSAAPDERRKGHARRLILWLKQSLRQLRRRIIAAEVEENNLPMQLLLKKCGFTWHRTIRRSQTNQDHYIFKYEGPKQV